MFWPFAWLSETTTLWDAPEAAAAETVSDWLSVA